MKCLIINGSTRKGNTWKLAELMKGNLQKLDTQMQFEEIHLADLHLPFCLGCSQCFRKGHTYCPHNEIIQKVMDQIEECDGVIFATSTFNAQVPAITKNLVDHLCFMLHRPRYFNKKAMVLSTTGGVGAKSSAMYIAGTLVGWGFNTCYQMPISSISWNDYQPTEKHKKQSLKLAKKFHSDLVSGKLHSPSLVALITYNVFRAMSRDYRPGTKFETYDGVYYDSTGLINETYSPMTPLPIYKRLFGNFFYLLGTIMSKYMVVTYKK